MVHYKLYYFKGRGRADFIRYILHYAGASYEEVTITLDEWRSGMKEKMPLYTIPVLELEDGRRLSQSLAISRYLAKKHGLLSDDDYENAFGDQMASAIEDIYPKPLNPKPTFSIMEEPDDVKKAFMDDIKRKLELLLEKFEEFLGDKKWFCGPKLHWADIVVGELVERCDSLYATTDFAKPKYPKLYAHSRRLHEIPAIKKYVEERPDYAL